MAHALSTSGARILVLERGDVVPREAENWSPDAVWRQPPVPHDRAVARRTRPRVPALHALRRRRQHQVLGQRPLPAAARRLPGDSSTLAACRPSGRSTTRRWRRIYDRAERLYQVHGEPWAPIPPNRRAALSATRPIPHSVEMSEIVEPLAAAGTAPLAAAAGPHRPREAGTAASCATPATRFPAVSAPRATPRPAASARSPTRANVTLWTGRARRAADHERFRAVESKPSRWCARASAAAWRRPSSCVSCGAVNSAALLLRSATDSHPNGLANSSGLVGRALHGPSGDDDGGLPSVQEEPHGVPEDRGDQRLLPARALIPMSRSARSSRRAGRTA